MNPSPKQPPRPIKLTNSLGHKKELLQTQIPGVLTFYSCGPTVYGHIHVGNLRAALVSDLLYRTFLRAGYEVKYARNYTDIDDRIIERSKQQGRDWKEFADHFVKEVEKDYSVAGILEPTFKPRATETIPQMLAMIERLIENKKAYVVDGEVFFSVQSLPTYGELSQKKLDELEAGIRVEVSAKKRHPHDFTLWKPAKSGEPSWTSPWGPGRPGWHIECSAMISDRLGDQIDVHHGGVDLCFPHHENEIAQSEGATGKRPFVRTWLHNGFLTMNSEKMSKSLGNVFSAREFMTRFSGEFARYLLLSVHYRSPIDFAEEAFTRAIQSLERIYEAKREAKKLIALPAKGLDVMAESIWGNFVADLDKAKREIDEHFANDFNTAGALASLFTVIREFNRLHQDPNVRKTAATVLAAQMLVQVIEEDIGGILGIGRKSPEDALADLSRMHGEVAKLSGKERPTPEEIEKLIAERIEARKQKNFARSDEIRKDLAARGVALKDSPTGTTWQYE